MFASLHRRRSRDERGSVTIQMVFLMPALFAVMFVIGARMFGKRFA